MRKKERENAFRNEIMTAPFTFILILLVQISWSVSLLLHIQFTEISQPIFSFFRFRNTQKNKIIFNKMDKMKEVDERARE